MGLKNDELTYGSVAKWIHWITALCFLGAYASYYYGHWFLEYQSQEYFSNLRIHTMCGTTVLLLFLPRLIWKIINPEPHPDPAPRWQHLAAKASHFALYFVLIAAPLSGWLGTGGRQVNFFGLFSVPTFRGTGFFDSSFAIERGITFQEFEIPVDFFHKQIMGEWVVWMLISVHVGAALYHHFVQRDNTLRRMAPGTRLK